MAEEQEDTKTDVVQDDIKPEKTGDEQEHVQETESTDKVESAEPAEFNEDAAGPGEPDTVEIDTGALNREIENLRQQLDESADNLLRTRAEMENLRKRTTRDIENAHKFALDRFIRELLPVLDSMELGINASDGVDDIQSLREGMDLTLKKFLDTLEKFGVSVIEAQGEKFDPEKHEAVSMQEMPEADSGTVITVMQKGYELNGRLVRPAMVIVAK